VWALDEQAQPVDRASRNVIRLNSNHQVLAQWKLSRGIERFSSIPASECDDRKIAMDSN
jgi:hypothetical protein